MAYRALHAAEAAAPMGVEAEVVDVRWIRPLDVQTIANSVAKTGRLVVVEEQVHAGGWGATLISELAQAGVRLESPPVVLGLPADLPIPYSPDLEDAVIPSIDRITHAILDVSGRSAEAIQ
jgi:acetoin:2,6-dichlorophenolindophenol oxidoreductase subunit beta